MNAVGRMPPSFRDQQQLAASAWGASPFPESNAQTVFNSGHNPLNQTTNSYFQHNPLSQTISSGSRNNPVGQNISSGSQLNPMGQNISSGSQFFDPTSLFDTTSVPDLNNTGLYLPHTGQGGNLHPLYTTPATSAGEMPGLSASSLAQTDYPQLYYPPGFPSQGPCGKMPDDSYALLTDQPTAYGAEGYALQGPTQLAQQEQAAPQGEQVPGDGSMYRVTRA